MLDQAVTQTILANDHPQATLPPISFETDDIRRVVTNANALAPTGFREEFQSVRLSDRRGRLGTTLGCERLDSARFSHHQASRGEDRAHQPVVRNARGPCFGGLGQQRQFQGLAAESARLGIERQFGFAGLFGAG